MSTLVEKRIKFTRRLSTLMFLMKLAGERFIIDWVLRSRETQHRFYKKGLTKCDGYRRISAHQRALAADIYFVKRDGRIDNNPKKYLFWHKVWEFLGGKPVITWDLGHFEWGE